MGERKLPHLGGNIMKRDYWVDNEEWHPRYWEDEAERYYREVHEEIELEDFLRRAAKNL